MLRKKTIYAVFITQEQTQDSTQDTRESASQYGGRRKEPATAELSALGAALEKSKKKELAQGADV